MKFNVSLLLALTLVGIAQSQQPSSSSLPSLSTPTSGGSAQAASSISPANHALSSPNSVGVYPGVDWEYDPNGLSPNISREVEVFVRTLDTTGLMVVKGGKVFYKYGDVSEVSYLPSARKSVLSMLYGRYVV